MNKIKYYRTMELETLKQKLIDKGFINSLIPIEHIFDFCLAGIEGELDLRKEDNRENKIISLEKEIEEKDKEYDELKDEKLEADKEYIELEKKLEEKIEELDKLKSDIYDLVAP